jgi:hypothetical protein
MPTIDFLSNKPADARQIITFEAVLPLFETYGL